MNNLSVLIAGTSSSYLEISKKMLKFHYNECEVDFAYSGNECINKVNNNLYDLVLFDYYLGDINGHDVIDTLRMQGNKVPLIMLTEEGEDEIASQAIEKGASDYIMKVRGYLTALPITVRNILERAHVNEAAKPLIPALKIKHTKNGKEGSFILDRSGRILSVNNRMEELTDYSEDELTELNLFDLLPKEETQSFTNWLNSSDENGNPVQSFKTEIISKTGNKILLEINLSAIKDENQQVVSFRGKAENVLDEKSTHVVPESRVDQLNMINQVSQIIVTSYYEPFNVFLEQIAELCCQTFRFKRATIALLDKRKKVFIKQAMVGYPGAPPANGQNMEVPLEVIQRVFANRFRVKVIYYNQVQREPASYLNAKFPERRTQKRRLPSQWHKRDLILLNLMNSEGQTYGYISLDNPIENNSPTRNTFENLELFGQLVSTAIENYYQFSTLEKRSRRLKQMLVTSNIFKLYLSLKELLQEVAWAIKFSMDFNFVGLGLISKSSGNLELKAVACDDKIKQEHLLGMQLPLKSFSKLFRSEYLRSKSYLVVKDEEVLHPIKHIYYGAGYGEDSEQQWRPWYFLLVPIKSREGKVIGVLMVDDPVNKKLPLKDSIRTLEILANQVAVAIDNRILYIQAQKRIEELKAQLPDAIHEVPNPQNSGLSHFVGKIFK
ncbi:MAG: response regulator [bacterium]